jgi:radical SAM superfamily enzyme YgiQ (UPF0313 family)
MSLASEVRDRAIASVDNIVLVMTRRGVVLPHPKSNYELTLSELVLLERLARCGISTVAAEVDAVVAETGDDPEHLYGLVRELDARGAFERTNARASISAEELAPPSSVRRPRDPELRFVIPTPMALGLTGGVFEIQDHEGRARIRLNARDLYAASAFTEPLTMDAAIAAHRQNAGRLALGERDLADLADALFAFGLLQSFDAANLAFHEGYNRAAEVVRRDSAGRKAVMQPTKREKAKLDKAEAARREAGATPRPKILPVHATKAAWRNPPLALGLIMAYAMEVDDGALTELYDFRTDWLIDERRVSDYTDEPAIYLFSSYVWSNGANLTISQKAKYLSPDSITIHGGPSVPKYEGDVMEWFEANPHADIAVHNEGELATAEILRVLAPEFAKGGPVDLDVLRDVPGISFRGKDGIVRTGPRERLADLNVIPSPYLSGLFENYVEGWQALADQGGTGPDAWAYQLPVCVLETNRGCPYGCTFCDWGSNTMSRIRQFDIERVFAEIEWCAKHNVDSIGLADANFGIFARDVDITAKVAEMKSTHNFPKQFGTNYAKNTVKHLQQIVQILSDVDILSFGLLSLQSMDEDTLTTIERSNIKLEKYEMLAREFQKAKLPLYVDLMMGLPGQTPNSFRNDLQECTDREVHAKIFPTMLLVNSPMNEPGYRKLHRIVAKPGELLHETASYTPDDYQEMIRIRSMFQVVEKYGVLRHLMRYVRSETGAKEMMFVRDLWSAVEAEPQRWPITHFMLSSLWRFMLPPVSWKRLFEEIREFVVAYGVADDDALTTVLEVQRALLPSRGRVFPETIDLPHDYAAWHAAMLDAKHDGHLADWETVVPKLRTFGPAPFTVTDPTDVCTQEIGRSAEDNTFSAWDIHSPVSRPVVLQPGAA